MNLATIIDDHPDDAVALVSRGRTTTYGQLRDDVARIRAGLLDAGLEPGERVGLLVGTNRWFVRSYLAVLGAGCVAVPLNPTAPARALSRELADVAVAAVVVGPAGRSAFAGVDRSEVPSLRLVVTADTDAPDEPGLVRFADLLTGEPGPIVERADDDVATLVFTSGTAGSPRAAMLTHGSLRANLDQLQSTEARALEPSDVALCALPLFHIFGLNVTLGLGLFAGASVVLVERFEPSSAAELVRTHGVTVIAGAPALWSAWTSLPGVGPEDFATVRLSVSGAARLSREVRELAEERMGLVLTEGYGLTEASPVVTSSVGRGDKPGSVGAPLPGVEVRLVDLDGSDVLVGDPGELWVRGPNVFAGYWADPETSAAVVGDDGWLRTGDVGIVDDDGDLFLVDRTKDLVIVSGFNVFPVEVEEVLMEHPAVERAAVLGVPHPHTGEAVSAYVVVRDGRSVEAEEMIAFCEARLPRYKCPEAVTFVPELPTGLGGKVQRWALGPQPA